VAGGPVLCGMDGSRGSDDALGVAAGFAERLDTELWPAHIAAVPSPYAAVPDEPGKLRVHGGNAVEQLRRRALEQSASVIVVGSRGQGPWRAALGSIASALAATAPVPVLVVSPNARGEHLAAAEAAVAGVIEGRPDPVAR
jgi:hypothetical protein